MWVWIIAFVVVCTGIAVVIARRGPGAGGYSADPRKQDPYGGGTYPGGGGYGGDGGGGG